MWEIGGYTIPEILEEFKKNPKVFVCGLFLGIVIMLIGSQWYLARNTEKATEQRNALSTSVQTLSEKSNRCESQLQNENDERAKCVTESSVLKKRVDVAETKLQSNVVAINQQSDLSEKLSQVNLELLTCRNTPNRSVQEKELRSENSRLVEKMNENTEKIQKLESRLAELSSQNNYCNEIADHIAQIRHEKISIEQEISSESNFLGLGGDDHFKQSIAELQSLRDKNAADLTEMLARFEKCL